MPLLIKSAECDFETEQTCAAIAGRFNADVVTLPYRHLTATARAWKRLRRGPAAHEVVHAFGSQALIAAMLATSAQRILFSPVGFPRRRLIAWLRAASGYRRIDVVCTSDTMRRAFVTRGIAAERCHLVRPGVNFRSIPTQRDDAVRARLGLAPDHVAILAPLEMTYAGGQRLTTWAMSLLEVIQPQYRLILTGDGPQAASIIHFGRKLLNPDLLIVARERAPEVALPQLFAASDAILLTPTQPVPPMIVAMSMVSGRPIVATTTPQLCELLEDRHTALLVAKPSPRLIAQRIMDLFADQQLGWLIQDRARAEAYDYLTQSKMLDAYDRLYRGETLAEPVSLPIVQATNAPAT
jgi:glycosyltransferase involved in cell wall biosynthesis